MCIYQNITGGVVLLMSFTLNWRIVMNSSEILKEKGKRSGQHVNSGYSKISSQILWILVKFFRCIQVDVDIWIALKKVKLVVYTCNRRKLSWPDRTQVRRCPAPTTSLFPACPLIHPAWIGSSSTPSKNMQG